MSQAFTTVYFEEMKNIIKSDLISNEYKVRFITIKEENNKKFIRMLITTRTTNLSNSSMDSLMMFIHLDTLTYCDHGHINGQILKVKRVGANRDMAEKVAKDLKSIFAKVSDKLSDLMLCGQCGNTDCIVYSMINEKK